MTTIIVPLDFSPTSLKAAAFGAELAAFYGATLWLYHAYELPVAVGEFVYPVVTVSSMQKAAAYELDMLRDKLKAGLKYAINIQCQAEMNDLMDGLQAFCDQQQPDLVIIGLSGKDALTKLVVGSNTIKIIHELTYPVLVVPPKAVFIPIRKIGFACDYKKVSATTPVTLIKKIVTDFNAALHVLNIDHHDSHFSNDLLDERFLMNELMGEVKAEFHSIESTDVTEGINWFAKRASLDWIVMIPKKHTILQAIFRRSHTNDLLYHTTLPILCIHQ